MTNKILFCLFSLSILSPLVASETPYWPIDIILPSDLIGNTEPHGPIIPTYDLGTQLASVTHMNLNRLYQPMRIMVYDADGTTTETISPKIKHYVYKNGTLTAITSPELRTVFPQNSSRGTHAPSHNESRSALMTPLLYAQNLAKFCTSGCSNWY